jgi:hypothetical protein
VSILIYALLFTSTATEVNGLEAGPDPDSSGHTKVSYWEELYCGIYSIQLKDLENSTACMKEGCVVEVKKHDWTDSSLHTLIRWERKSIVPTPSIDEVNQHLSQSFRNLRKVEDSTSIGLEKRDLPSDFGLSPVNCITQSGT